MQHPSPPSTIISMYPPLSHPSSCPINADMLHLDTHKQHTKHTAQFPGNFQNINNDVLCPRTWGHKIRNTFITDWGEDNSAWEIHWAADVVCGCCCLIRKKNGFKNINLKKYKMKEKRERRNKNKQKKQTLQIWQNLLLPPFLLHPKVLAAHIIGTFLQNKTRKENAQVIFSPKMNYYFSCVKFWIHYTSSSASLCASDCGSMFILLVFRDEWVLISWNTK